MEWLIRLLVVKALVLKEMSAVAYETLRDLGQM